MIIRFIEGIKLSDQETGEHPIQNGNKNIIICLLHEFYFAILLITGMSYSNVSTGKKRNIFQVIKIKTGRILASSFPLNSVRVRGLRMCGYKIGTKVYIGSRFMLAAMNSETGDSLEIEDRVAIGPGVILVLSSDANYSKLVEKIPLVRGHIHLKKDCWLGAGVIILPNVTIGECAVIAAGSVVTKNVPDHAIVGGVPAREISSRFSESS